MFDSVQACQVNLERRRARLEHAARVLLEAVRQHGFLSTEADEAEIPFEKALIAGAWIEPDEFVMEIDTDDIVDPADINKRVDILVITTTNDRILQITVKTGEVLVVKE